MRSITVAARWPDRKARICATMSAGLRPVSLGTALSTPGLAGWQPEQDAAPTGDSGEAAMADAIDARMAAPAMERRVNFMDKTFTRTRRPSGRASGSRKFDVMILQRKRANSLARRTEERVENRRPCDADRRLAYATPEGATRHDDRFDLRHLGDAHRVVRIEILLLDASVLDRTLLIEQG